MHYYKRNLGDYAKKAGRLSILQHGVYNLLIDACYDREEFPTTEEAIDWVWASTQEEEDAVRFVLKKFFTQGEDGKWVQGRIAEELEEYRKFCEEQARKGKAGGRPKKPAGLSEKPNGKPDESQRGQKKTLTTNHKPLTTNQDISANAVGEIFDHWQLTMGESGKRLTDGRRKKIKSRLKHYPVTDLLRAIDGCRGSPWHMGDNPNSAKYNDIELIFRNDENLEKFRDMVTPNQQQEYEPTL